MKGVNRRGAQYPDERDENGDLRPTDRTAREDETIAGSDADWTWVQGKQIPMFIMTAYGFALRLDDPVSLQLRGPHKAWAIRFLAANRGGEATRKCSWVKKYQG